MAILGDKSAEQLGSMLSLSLSPGFVVREERVPRLILADEKRALYWGPRRLDIASWAVAAQRSGKAWVTEI